LCIPGGLADVGKQLVQKAELYGIGLETLREAKPWQWVYKVFPAMVNPEATLATGKAWRAVYPGLQLVYTGGVTLDNVGYLAGQDRDGIFCGSAVARYASEPERMRKEAERWLEAIAGARARVARNAEEGKGEEEKRDRGKGKGGKGKGEAVAARSPNTASRVNATAESQVKPAGPRVAPRVVTFGEIMLRLSPPVGRRFRQATTYDVTYGGAEANVAVALAQWGVESRYVTVLPTHDIGQSAVDLLRSLGVDTSFIRRRGDRVGIYFLEHGASQRPSRVIYDRAGSAIASIEPGEIDWADVFAGADWFHCTGITPALSVAAAEVTAEAVIAAKRAGLSVSVDLNYRSKLWSRDRAATVMTPLMEYVDVVIANEEDAEKVFGIAARGARPDAGEIDAAGYEDVARQLVDRFDLRLAAITLRESQSASDNTWSACLWDGQQFLHSRSYPIHLVDRVGGGDAFAAGLIFGLLAGKDNRSSLEFGVAASCLKQTIVGDFNIATVSEVEAVAGGSTAGRIKR
jgi:2-dehydro-3-deoxygluconokinase